MQHKFCSQPCGPPRGCQNIGKMVPWPCGAQPQEARRAKPLPFGCTHQAGNGLEMVLCSASGRALKREAPPKGEALSRLPSTTLYLWALLHISTGSPGLTVVRLTDSQLMPTPLVEPGWNLPHTSTPLAHTHAHKHAHSTSTSNTQHLHLSEPSSPSSTMMAKSCAVWAFLVAKHW